jgi:8-oxo-dGTP pyrophosphatase MutT (NUDIX family)
MIVDNKQDKKRTIISKGKNINFVQIDPSFIPPFDKITSAAVVPFTEDGKIVAALLNRGIDLPGGHVLKTEFNIEDVARREAGEETCITFKDVYVSKIIQSDYYGTASNELTYMIITTAFVDEMLDFIPTEECVAREVVTVDLFINRYSAGNKEDMRKLILTSQKLLGIDKD